MALGNLVPSAEILRRDRHDFFGLLIHALQANHDIDRKLRYRIEDDGLSSDIHILDIPIEALCLKVRFVNQDISYDGSTRRNFLQLEGRDLHIVSDTGQSGPVIFIQSNGLEVFISDLFHFTLIDGIQVQAKHTRDGRDQILRSCILYLRRLHGSLNLLNGNILFIGIHWFLSPQSF